VAKHSDHFEVKLSQNLNVFGSKTLQCWMVQVGVSQCLKRGWSNDQGITGGRKLERLHGD
jgi:hypothetical protein